MKMIVVADESGALIGGMLLGRSRVGVATDPQGAKIRPQQGQVLVTVDVPDELLDRIPNAKYLETLRQYIVKNGSLVKQR